MRDQGENPLMQFGPCELFDAVPNIPVKYLDPGLLSPLAGVSQ